MRLHNSHTVILLVSILLVGCNSNPEKALPAKIDFNFHVKPILSDRCFACHGPDKNALKADLRLDMEEGALRKLLESGAHAIVPKNLNKSEAYQRIISEDPEIQMPPPESGLSLSPREKEIIAKWIEQGAEYKPHWAFIPSQKPNTPEVDNEEWIRNPIDNFTLRKLEEIEIDPNSEASKEILLRRVSLDLTGLPPTIQELDNFLDDDSEDAYEKVVDRLLSSPHFGERMALEWLDVARYADSHGYSTDGYRMMWPWRDWVIKAFNENMPYDQFISWQIAGDQFPNPTEEQRLATAFLRNQKLNAEGGIIMEEYLVEYASDRTETVSTAFLGLTFQCAKCHDHKYDPVSQKDYYQLYGFFNNVNERGLTQNDGNSGPMVLLTPPNVDERVSIIDKEIDELKKLESQLLSRTSPTKSDIKIDLNQGLLVDLPFNSMVKRKVRNKAKSGEEFSASGISELTKGKYGQGLKFTGYERLNIQNSSLDFDRGDTFSFSFWINPHYENDYMPIILHSAGKNGGYKGYELSIIEGHPTLRLINGLPANVISVSTDKPIPNDKWTHLSFSYDGSSKAAGVKVYLNGSIDKGKTHFDQLNQSFSFNKSAISVGGLIDYQVDIKGYGVIDNLKIYNRKISDVEAQALFKNTTTLSQNISNESIAQHYLSNSNRQYAGLMEQIQKLRKEKFSILDTIPAVMVMQDLPEPRPTFVLNRGSYEEPGEQVQPNTPKFVLPYPQELPPNRLGLAKWLTDSKNPLTARVIVNRYWQIFFGTGIVKTTEDFGSQGALPHHPELLDYLAYTFVETGWDLKELLKQIVMSSTYRQSSTTSEENRKNDPENSLLARGPSHRLQAELIRDNALAASGLLVRKIGGESAKPYQPEGLWAEITGNSRILDKYRVDSGEQKYRRGLYTFWRRTSPPPSMITFDAPTRDVCIVKREETNTPLQALVLLNDPQFFEAARVLAQRVLNEKTEVKEQIILAHRLLTSLYPDDEVLDMLVEHYYEEEKRFEQNPELVEELVSVGDYQIDESLEPQKLGAMSVVCNLLMSFDETIVKR